jgi:hypothetical protein
MKRLFVALTFLSAFILLAACGAETATPTPTPLAATAASRPTLLPTATSEPQAEGICAPGDLPEYIREVVLAKDARGNNYTPVDITEVFEPTQATFHAVVSIQNAPPNLKLGSTWYLVQADGYKSNTKIDENELSVADGGTRNVDFTLKTSQDHWPPGVYCVEIYAQDSLALSKRFTVTGEGAPSSTTTAVVKQIVLAEDTQPATFEPVNPTDTFDQHIPFIHASVQIENAPPNTQFRARWYPPSQNPLDFQVVSEGTRWIDFQLKQTPTGTPIPEGFPTGQYKVEIYVNDELADTKIFTVK